MSQIRNQLLVPSEIKQDLDDYDQIIPRNALSSLSGGPFDFSMAIHSIPHHSPYRRDEVAASVDTIQVASQAQNNMASFAATAQAFVNLLSSAAPQMTTINNAPHTQYSPNRVSPLPSSTQQHFARPKDERLSSSPECPSPCPTASLKYNDLLLASTSATKTPQIGCPEDCVVCGDTSTGYHYDVPSCNGCKTFYRRTLLAQRTFVCKKGGNCFVVLPKGREKRCQCRACRFDKCVEVGMNPLAIVADQDFSQNDMIMAVVAKRKAQDPPPEEQIEVVDTKIPKKLFSTCQEGVNKVIEGLLYLELKHQKLRQSTFNPKYECDLTLEKVLKRKPMIGTELEDMPDWPLPAELLNKPTGRTLEMYIKERAKIPPFTPDSGLPENQKLWFFCDIIYSIEYLRTFEFFSVLELSDKIALLKNAVHQCVNLTTSWFSFTNKCDATMYPDGKIVPKRFNCTKSLDVVHVMIQLNLDKAEYVLVKALMLCNPSWESLSPSANRLLSPFREQYAKSLMNYCLAKRGPIEGPAAYGKMMSMIDQIYHYAKKHKEVLTLVAALKLRTTPCTLMEELGD